MSVRRKGQETRRKRERYLATISINPGIVRGTDQSRLMRRRRRPNESEEGRGNRYRKESWIRATYRDGRERRRLKKYVE